MWLQAIVWHRQEEERINPRRFASKAAFAQYLAETGCQVAGIPDAGDLKAWERKASSANKKKCASSCHFLFDGAACGSVGSRFPSCDGSLTVMVPNPHCSFVSSERYGQSSAARGRSSRGWRRQTQARVWYGIKLGL